MKINMMDLSDEVEEISDDRESSPDLETDVKPTLVEPSFSTGVIAHYLGHGNPARGAQSAITHDDSASSSSSEHSPAAQRYDARGHHNRTLPPSSQPIRSRARPKRKRVISLEQRKAANIRERRRMLNLNEEFERLRRIVPTFSYEKKISRIETLRLAIMYIYFLTEVLQGQDPRMIRLQLLEANTRSDTGLW